MLDIIKKRRSTRFFKTSDYILPNDLMNILESTTYAPSAKNLQPIEFIVIEEQTIRDKLSQACDQRQPSQAPICIVVIGNLELAGRVGKISTHKITTKEKGQNIFIYMDAAACIQNMLLTATSIKIDSLWISSFKSKPISQMMKLPDHYIPLAVICLGHRSKAPFSPKKVPLIQRLHFHVFKEKSRNPDYLEDCKKVNEISGEYKSTYDE